jgi:hypothetical protein
MVIGQCMPRHRHQEWLKFLKTIDREVPEDLAIHLILDIRHPQTPRRPHVAGQASSVPPAFTPTSSSWLNGVERWFRELTDRALRRGAFHSVPDLIASIRNTSTQTMTPHGLTCGQRPPNPSSLKSHADASPSKDSAKSRTHH